MSYKDYNYGVFLTGGNYIRIGVDFELNEVNLVDFIDVVLYSGHKSSVQEAILLNVSNILYIRKLDKPAI